MQIVKHGKPLVVTITAVVLLAGAAGARADGPRAPRNGGVGLTGGGSQSPTTGGASLIRLVPSASAVSPVSTPTAVSPVPVPSTPTAPTAPAVAPPAPATALIPPAAGAIPPSPEPPAAPAPAAVPPPAAANTTTQTITQVQVSTCLSHCRGGNQTQQASQSNTTVQAVGPPVPSDGGAGLAPAHSESRRPSKVARPGTTQVQVGCVEHCHGTTTRDHSGLTLAQIEQLLDQIQAPSPPAATAVPGDVQNVTQQAAAQSQSGGSQSQVARQSNGTVQAVAAPAGPTDTLPAAPPAAAVNQTAQGVVQLQVGCIFYCSGTRQTQQAQQSTTTVQSVSSGGAGAANTVARVVWQVQVGCVEWCDNTVETQSAGASDSTVVAVAPPPVSAAPAGPGEGAPPASTPTPSTAVRRGPSGGAAVRVPVVAGVAGGESPTRAIFITTLERSRRPAGGFRVKSTVRHGVARHGRRPVPRRTASRALRAAPPVIVAPSAVTASSTAQPTLELAVVLTLALAALGLTGLRRRGVR